MSQHFEECLDELTKEWLETLPIKSLSEVLKKSISKYVEDSLNEGIAFGSK